MRILYKRKIIRNLGNYENITIEIEVEDSVNYEQDQTYESVYNDLRSKVGKSIAEESLKIDQYLKNKDKK